MRSKTPSRPEPPAIHPRTRIATRLWILPLPEHDELLQRLAGTSRYGLPGRAWTQISVISRQGRSPHAILLSGITAGGCQDRGCRRGPSGIGTTADEKDDDRGDDYYETGPVVQPKAEISVGFVDPQVLGEEPPD